MEAEAAIRVSLSEPSEASGNHYVLKPLCHLSTTLTPPPTPPTAYTPWNCGGSHKFVHLNFISRLQAPGAIVKTRNRGHMDLTTAGRRERMPPREARLSLDIGSFHYLGWFVLYKLAKYDAILGKSWMEEVPHHVDLSKNTLWLGQDSQGGQCK